MTATPPIDRESLPPASTFLTYRTDGPEIGKYLGPTTSGDYLTAVSREYEAGSPPPGYGPRIRVGLAFGCYTINGEPTDPDGLPVEVLRAKLRADLNTAGWQPHRRPQHPVINAGGNDA